MRTLDYVLAVWVAAWLAMGVAVASELRGLTELSTTLVEVGQSTGRIGSTLRAVGELPLVGDQIQGPAEDVQRAAASAVRSGRSSRSSIETASALLGIAVAVIPSVPPLALYLPMRMRWSRDRRALLAVRDAAGDDPRFELWLAKRALERLPYAQVAAVVERPWEPADEAAARALADAELARFGLRRDRAP